MTALDYATCLGCKTLIQMLEPLTKVRTEVTRMPFEEYLKDHFPGRDLRDPLPITSGSAL